MIPKGCALYFVITFFIYLFRDSFHETDLLRVIRPFCPSVVGLCKPVNIVPEMTYYVSGGTLTLIIFAFYYGGLSDAVCLA